MADQLLSLDVHIHTIYSSTSSVPLEAVFRYAEIKDLPLLTLTDFGTVEGCLALRQLFTGRRVMMGIEVRAPEGDFLVFSSDEEYVSSLPERIPTVRHLRRDERTVVIWAHPFVSQHAKTYEVDSLPEVGRVVPFIDGLELFNGTMLSMIRDDLLQVDYYRNLMRIALDHGLAMLAGSDAHEPDLIGRCHVTFESRGDAVTDFLRAVKQQRIMPHYDHEYFKVKIPLG